ncbi:flippase [Massilia sp. BHUDP2]|uniref:flippase n=1 Tax=Massilia sp. BHUDP2 TaxID=3034505 RepID=UPI0039059131
MLRNSFYNLVGLGLPLVVALAAMPQLIHMLGVERFGILTLIWAVVSYFGLFDLGLGRAITQELSVLLAEKKEEEIPFVLQSGLLTLGLLGVLAGLLLWTGAAFAASQVSYQGDRAEIADSIRVMALAMPAILLTTGLRGILEANSEFVVLNIIRVPMGLLTFLGPLAVVYVENSLVMVTAVLVLGRYVAGFAHLYYVLRSFPRAWGQRCLNTAVLNRLLASGGWMTVSNLVSPLMGYLDRFLIGICISAAAVAYYVTPNEMVTKLWILPSALTAVLFPRFAAQIRVEPENAKRLYKQGVCVLFCVVYPVTLLLSTFSHEILAVWIGAEFAEKSAVVMQIFCFGIMVNCLAHIPFSAIQGAGQARTTALVHVCEFLPFAVVLAVLAMSFGIVGAAIAWLLRMLIDSAIMFKIAGRLVGRFEIGIVRLASCIAIVSATYGAAAIASPLVRGVLVFLSIFFVLAATKVLAYPSARIDFVSLRKAFN